MSQAKKERDTPAKSDTPKLQQLNFPAELLIFPVDPLLLAACG